MSFLPLIKVRETTSYIDLSNVKEVIATDDSTVDFILKHPDSTFEYTIVRIANYNTNSPSYENEIIDEYLNRAINTTNKEEAL